MKINKLGVPNRKPLTGIWSPLSIGKSWGDGEAALALYTRCLRCNTPRRICDFLKKKVHLTYSYPKTCYVDFLTSTSLEPPGMST